ncbi:MAG: BMC domain-containing protein [bacterium]|jgi:ethanolamine utilization protein EutM
MHKKALGLIEIEGLVCAVEVADAAVKAANVELLGYELTRGLGMVTVKLQGDVAAVQAAVSAGVAAGKKVGRVVAKHVIPRPHGELHGLIDTPDMVPGSIKKCKVPEKEGERGEEPIETGEGQLQKEEGVEGPGDEVEGQPEKGLTEEEEKPAFTEAVCNLCGDPDCPRRKGEPHSRCLHYQEGK